MNSLIKFCKGINWTCLPKAPLEAGLQVPGAGLQVPTGREKERGGVDILLHEAQILSYRNKKTFS